MPNNTNKYSSLTLKQLNTTFALKKKTSYLRRHQLFASFNSHFMQLERRRCKCVKRFLPNTHTTCTTCKYVCMYAYKNTKCVQLGIKLYNMLTQQLSNRCHHVHMIVHYLWSPKTRANWVR